MNQAAAQTGDHGAAPPTRAALQAAAATLRGLAEQHGITNVRVADHGRLVVTLTDVTRGYWPLIDFKIAAEEALGGPIEVLDERAAYAATAARLRVRRRPFEPSTAPRHS